MVEEHRKQSERALSREGESSRQLALAKLLKALVCLLYCVRTGLGNRFHGVSLLVSLAGVCMFQQYNPN